MLTLPTFKYVNHFEDLGKAELLVEIDMVAASISNDIKFYTSPIDVNNEILSTGLGDKGIAL